MQGIRQARRGVQPPRRAVLQKRDKELLGGLPLRWLLRRLGLNQFKVFDWHNGEPGLAMKGHLPALTLCSFRPDSRQVPPQVFAGDFLHVQT